MSKKLITITGPSGSGKSELLNRLCATGKFSRLISVATRPPREGEKDGVDYHFTNSAIFERLLEQDAFVQFVNFRNQYYGTLKEDAKTAIEAGTVPVVIVEPTGVPQFRKFCEENGFELFTIFVQADFEVLVSRYMHRLGVHDFENSERIDYHARRIAAIHDEHTKWKDTESFNITFHNSGNDLTYIEEMATMVGNFLQEKNNG
jgi:guanylate kinase